jgi:hypothetical protein
VATLTELVIVMAAFTTKLSLGQIAFVVAAYTKYDYRVVTMNVGQIRVQVTAPKSRTEYDDGPLFLEQYMCVETGVGSGRIYTIGIDIFATEEEAKLGVIAHEQKAHKQRMERDEHLRKQREIDEARDRYQLEQLKKKYETT